ncbi:MAG: hypothetical protein KAY24_19480, partial [Candidatus Eisenbacteria sp.]|nr:hypothetical protein [Candidatus Eisenbacteria bacterium]
RDAGRVGQLGQFGQRFLDRPVAIGRGTRAFFQFDPYQKSSFLRRAGGLRWSGDASPPIMNRCGKTHIQKYYVNLCRSAPLS